MEMHLSPEQAKWLTFIAIAVAGILLEYKFSIVRKFFAGEKAVVGESKRIIRAIESDDDAPPPKPIRTVKAGMKGAVDHLVSTIWNAPDGTLAEKNAALAALGTAIQPLMPKGS